MPPVAPFAGGFAGVVLFAVLPQVAPVDNQLTKVFRQQDWVYNASLFWDVSARLEPHTGEAVVDIANLFTDLVAGAQDAVFASCTAQRNFFCQVGSCYMPQVVDFLIHHTNQFSEGLREVAPRLPASLQSISLHLADLVSQLVGAVPACAFLADLVEIADSEDLCGLHVLDLLQCVKGISGLSRVAMSRIHAAQVAASFPDGPLRTAQPTDMVFDGTRGSRYDEVLASLLSDISEVKQDSVVTAAEVGVHMGQTSSFLLEELPLLEMILVDPFEYADATYFEEHGLYKDRPDAARTFDIFWDRLRPYRNRSVIISQRSPGAARWVPNAFLDLIFIDSFHAYDELKADIEAWLPKLRRPGILAGHDYGLFWPGVCDAVHEFAVSNGLPLVLGPEGMWWFQL